MIRSFPKGARFLRTLLEDPLRRFQLSLLLLALLVLVGTTGYRLIEDMSIVDSVYMTIITVATIGFGEVKPLSDAGKIFTIVFIILGVSTGAWAITNGVEILLGGNVWLSLQRRRLLRVTMDIQNHYIVCGYGRMGRQIVRDLQSRDEEFVIIEKSPEMEVRLLEEGYPHIIGDAENDEVLVRAGVKRARGVVSALDTDASNVLTVLAARELNPDLLIVARATNEPAESKLRRAGADRVVSPEAIGGHRLALALLQPKVHDFLEKIFSIEEMDVDMGEIVIGENSPYAGMTVAATDLRGTLDLTILAIQSPAGEFIISPDADRIIVEGETLIVIGPLIAIAQISDIHDRSRGKG